MAFVSKSRKVRFSLTLSIHDLNNVPLVSGTSTIKWHLPASTSAEHRGRTQKCAIKDHRVQYNYEKATTVRLIVAKSGQLQECTIDFEVQQEYSAGGRGERITLGHIHLNLAEYVNASEPASPGKEVEEGQGITRRYLMQDSKINSTLKIGIRMQHLEGTRDYYAPALRTAPVFGGIAGIISSSDPAATTAQHSEAAARGADEDGADAAAMPNFSTYTTTSKEIGEMQDMYRKTLSAYWSSQPGELKADECIEDIFAGGDGWGKGGRPSVNVAAANQHNSSHSGSGASTPNNPEENSSRGDSGGGSGSVGTMLHRHNFSRHHNKQRQRPGGAGELEEMDVRNDLKGWRIGEAAYS